MNVAKFQLGRKKYFGVRCTLIQDESKCEIHFHENDFDLHENERAGGTHFHLNGFAFRLVLTQKRSVTRKPLSIGFYEMLIFCLHVTSLCSKIQTEELPNFILMRHKGC